MRRLLLTATLLAAVALAQGPTETTVSDTIWNTSVTITVTPATGFTTADGYNIAGGFPFTVTSSTGAFTIALPPNANSVPANTYYIAHYSTPFRSWNETWIIPASATPVKLSAVRGLLPPSPSYIFAFGQILPPANCIALGGFVQDTALGWTCNASAGGSGTVTSVGLAAPAWLSVTGSPVTASGTLTFAAATGQTAHEWLGTGAGSSVSLQALTAADIPQSLTSSTSGNAATATALATTPTQCPSTQIVTGVAANGNADCQDPLVSGPTAIGAAPGINNPVFVAGWDGTDIRGLLTDTSGHAVVNINGTVPVSGTFWQATQPVSLASLPALPSGSNTVGSVNQAGVWTVGISGTPAVSVSGNVSVVGTASDNTANSTAKLPVIPAVANTAAPTYTSGDQVPLSTDTGGNLRVTCANCSGGSGGTAQADAGSFTQGTSSFTPVGGEYNTSPTSLTSGQAGAVLMTATRHLDVAVADALPTGSNTIGAVTGSGTFTVAGTITSNIGTTNGLALDATVSGTQVAQGSTTSGQHGTLMQGAVTTSAPTYTTAQTSPLSLTTAGAVRVDASATTQPVSGTVTANQGTAPWTTEPQPTSTAAQAPTAFTSTSVTSATTIDASPGNLFHYEATNTGTAACYLEFFNAATGSVTLGTTAPIWTVPLMATSSFSYSRNNAPTVGALFAFSTALSAAAVTTAGGSTTCPANTIVLNAAYK